MNADFVKELRDDLVGPKVIAANGREQLVVPPGWKDETRVTQPMPWLNLCSLTGVIDYLEANIDELPIDELLLHVANHQRVDLCSKIVTVDGGPHRHVYIQAVAPTESRNFGQYLDSETFTVWLQTGFSLTAEREELIRLVASIRENAVRETVDDGVAQEVKTAAGVTLTERTKIPNPVKLRPYRTFREIPQPESLFVLRMRSAPGEKPQCALFEADGGTWKLEAMALIANLLQEKTTGIAIIS